MTEFRPGSFQILPTIIKNLLIINVLIFLAQNVVGNGHNFSFEDTFALHTWQSDKFEPWQFLTYMFLHGGIDHILFNMFALWMFGSILENLWGPKRFLLFYIVCGLGAALCHMIVLYVENQHMIAQYMVMNPGDFIAKYGADLTASGGAIPISPDYAHAVLNADLDIPTLGASGAIFGCLAAFGYLFPNTYIYLYFFFPIKAKWFVLGYAAVELFMAVKGSAGDDVAHIAHLGGALVGIILVYFWNNNKRNTFY
jgi:membrane associated rhomboid family serine protease